MMWWVENLPHQYCQYINFFEEWNDIMSEENKEVTEDIQEFNPENHKLVRVMVNVDIMINAVESDVPREQVGQTIAQNIQQVLAGSTRKPTHVGMSIRTATEDHPFNEDMYNRFLEHEAEVLEKNSEQIMSEEPPHPEPEEQEEVSEEE